MVLANNKYTYELPKVSLKLAYAHVITLGITLRLDDEVFSYRIKYNSNRFIELNDYPTTSTKVTILIAHIKIEQIYRKYGLDIIESALGF